MSVCIMESVFAIPVRQARISVSRMFNFLVKQIISRYLRSWNSLNTKEWIDTGLGMKKKKRQSFGLLVKIKPN